MKKYDVFISYSRTDKAFAQSVCQVFDAYKKYYKFEYFFDTSEIVIKNEYLERMAIAISQSKSMLFIASKNSYSSRFCTKELLYADEYGVGIYRYCLDKSKAPQKIDFLLIDQHYLEVELCPIEEMVRQVLSETLKQDIKPLSEFQRDEYDVVPNPTPSVKDKLKGWTNVLVYLSLAFVVLFYAIRTCTDSSNEVSTPTTMVSEVLVVKDTLKKEPVPQAAENKKSASTPNPAIPPADSKIGGIDMVFVKGGTFTMGATAEQGSDAYSNEKPTHSVTVSDFYIGKYEVTQAQWKAVMGSNPSKFTGDNNPVEQVSWNDIQEFITKLNAQTGKKYRLPTEAEWEYAARGGNQSKGYKYSGSNSIGDVAWYYSNTSYNTYPVGQKTPNELGIYDMSGNVGEWCQDLYGYYSSEAQTNPTGPSSGSDRVLRGGSWCSYARFCRVSYRSCSNPDDPGINYGFRLACSAE